LDSFFSVFYVSINIGSTIGTILTPILRADIKCFGNDCYPLAFGIPTLIMLIAIVVFVLGTPFYKKDTIKKENIIVNTFCCIFNAIKNRIKAWKTANKKEHWLDYSIDKYSAQMITDVKAFCRVFLVFLPLPIFWALFDQQGSRWTEQAQQLNGRVGSVIIKPDQFQVFNPVFIITLVPLFDYVIYPLFSKINLFKRQLQRMVVGFLFTGLAFGIAAFLEFKMQDSSILLNRPNQINLINLSPCDLNIENIADLPKSSYLNNQVVKLPRNVIDSIFSNGNSTQFKINIKNCFANSSSIAQRSLIINNNALPKSLIFYLDASSGNIDFKEYSYDIKNQVIGRAEIKFEYFDAKTGVNNDLKELIPVISNSIVKYDQFQLVLWSQNMNKSNMKIVDNADYDLKVNNKLGQNILSTKIMLDNCGRYTVLIFRNNLNQTDYVFLTDIYPNGIHLGWQLIQIFIMTVSEIMVSISGLSFAYSQAPASMKSVLQSLWLMTVAFGNLIVVIVAESRIVKDQVYEYLAFTALLLLATIGFAIVSYFYKYVEEDKKDDLIIEKKSSIRQKNSYGINNLAVSESTDSNLKLVSMNSLDN
jgi:dipeptide/tripeptide permease